jgi:hypothetical protein
MPPASEPVPVLGSVDWPPTPPVVVGVPSVVMDVPDVPGVLTPDGVVLVVALVGVPDVVVPVPADDVPVVPALGVPTWPNAEPAPASANARIATPAAIPNAPDNFLVADTVSS